MVRWSRFFRLGRDRPVSIHERGWIFVTDICESHAEPLTEREPFAMWPLRLAHPGARSSPCSHARAAAHSRLTVVGDSPIASAVSSTVKPAK